MKTQSSPLESTPTSQTPDPPATAARRILPREVTNQDLYLALRTYLDYFPLVGEDEEEEESQSPSSCNTMESNKVGFLSPCLGLAKLANNIGSFRAQGSDHCHVSFVCRGISASSCAARRVRSGHLYQRRRGPDRLREGENPFYVGKEGTMLAKAGCGRQRAFICCRDRRRNVADIIDSTHPSNSA